MNEYYVQYYCFSRDGMDDIQSEIIEADSEEQAHHIAKVGLRARHVIQVLKMKHFKVETDRLNIVVKETSIYEAISKLRREYKVEQHAYLTIREINPETK